MNLGMIVRCDNSGIGIQTLEAYRHLKPKKTMVVDRSADSGFESFPERYPDGKVVMGIPTPTESLEFLKNLDVVFMVEAPYSHKLLELADFQGTKTIIQYNYELMPYIRNPEFPRPTLLAAPTKWHYEDVPFKKTLLPVPIATERFQPRPMPKVAKHFIHIVGRPAIHDRNGTNDLLGALKYIDAPIRLTLKFQSPQFVPDWVGSFQPPGHIELEIDTTNKLNYWENYQQGDVLVMPRRYGGLSLSVNEALGAGMPVIMSDISPNEWLPKDWRVPATKAMEFMAHNMIDVYETNEEMLGKLINRMAVDAKFYQWSCREAQKLAQEHSWEKLKPLYRQTFSDILKG